MARKEILANPESLTGKDLATAGIVLGWIGVALSILSILVIIGLIVLGVLFFIPMSVTSGYYGTSILPVLFLF